MVFPGRGSREWPGSDAAAAADGELSGRAVAGGAVQLRGRPVDGGGRLGGRGPRRHPEAAGGDRV